MAYHVLRRDSRFGVTSQEESERPHIEKSGRRALKTCEVQGLGPAHHSDDHT